jgi:WD40 repeat protein
MRLASRELERRVNARDSLACESVLQLYPQLSSDAESLLELIYLEFVLRQELGDEQALSSLIARFPTWQTEILKLVQVDQAMVATHPTQLSVVRRPSRSARTAAGPSPQLPEQFGDYELLEVIGSGGMGVVYRAVQLKLNRLVALKTIETFASFSPNAIARFNSEAELAARLQHPNIVQIHEINTVSGVPYFSMEFVRGGNLAEATRHAPLQPLVAARLCQILSSAVGYAHSQGVVHRDLKPANILLAPSSRQEAIDLQLDTQANYSPSIKNVAGKIDPKIADFGLAKRLETDSQATLTGTVIGTPSYMAPEQVDNSLGDSGPTSDVYALGAVLYHCLVGRPPFHAASAVETMHQVRHQEPVPLRKIQPKIPVDLDTICLTCLQKNPSLRYQSADALADDLGRFLRGESIVARPSGPLERSLKWTRRHPSLALLIGSVLIASLATTWLWRRAEMSRVAERAQRTRAESLVYARDISLAHLEYHSNHVDRCEQILQDCDPSQRNWEWNYLKNLCQEHVWETPRFDLPILSTALSCDGSWLACSYGNWGRDRPEPIRVWNLRTRELAYELPVTPGNIHCVQFSPDGRWLLSTGVTYSSGKGSTRVGTDVWSLEDGSPSLRIASIGGIVARFLPEGKSILVGTSTGTIQQYARDTGQLMREFRGHSSMVLDIAISQDGKEFFSSAKDRSVRRWDLEAGKSTGELAKLVGDDPFELELSPNGSQLLVAGWAGSLNTYHRHGSGFKLASSQKLAGLPHNRYSPDGLFLLTASYGEGAQLRDVHSGEIIYQVHARAGNIKAMAFDRSGRILATGNSDGSTRVWDLSHINHLLTQGNTIGPKIAVIASHPQQREIALATQLNHLNPKANNMAIELRHLDQLQQPRYLTGHDDWPTCVAYSLDGSQLVSGSADTTVRVWDVATAKSLTVLRGHMSPIIGAAFLDQHDQLASVDVDGKIIVWDKLKKGQSSHEAAHPDSLYAPRHEWNTHQKLTSMSVSLPGRLLALATASGAIEIWDLVQGRAVAKLAGQPPIRRMHFSPTGDVLAVVREGSPAIELRELQSLRYDQPSPPVLLKGHTDQVNSITFSHDGKRLASSSRDESIRLFDVSTGHELLNFHIARGLENLVHLCHTDDLVFAEEHRLYCLSAKSSQTQVVDSATKQFFDKTSTLAWHTQQLGKAKTTGDSWANIFHRQALAELRPPTAAELSARAIQRAFSRDFQGARSDFLDAIAIEDKRSYHEAIAVLNLNLARLPDYQRECQLMIDRTSLSGDMMEINSSVWTCALSEQSGIDLDVWTKNLEAAYTKAKNSSPAPKKEYLAAFENTLGLATYRCQRFETAIEHIQASLKLGSFVPAIDYAILAMAYRQLDQPDKAHASLKRAQTYAAEMQQAEDSGTVLSSVQRRAKVLELHLLLAEAKLLLDSPNQLFPDTSH